MSAEKALPEWLECRNLAEWHDWLAWNHDKQTAVWLRIKKVSWTGEGVLLDEAVIEAIRFGWIDGRARGLDEQSYLLRLTPRKPDSVWSQINRRRAENLIAEGRMTEAGMATVRAAQANGNWQAAYTSREKPGIPADLAAALQKDPAAAASFDNWSNSDQVMAVFWLDQARRPATRQKRVDTIVSSARANRKPFSN